MLVIRHEDATGEASRALFAEYIGLVRERLGSSFVPTEQIFATEDDFDAAGAAWLVLYEGDAAVACGGLRPLAPGVGEIKRMFVTAPARGRGHARALLAELERLAADAGCRRVRLYTTEVLREARALYSACGYRPVGVVAVDGRIDLWLEKTITHA
ncbi:MAG TPA: GNAT family N-acetyltransferase [Solirubrobacteraceae bacterium]|nr:GNAT family N-acetyltransferase [Solirubrobacteraceae bacterium]